MAVNEVIHLAVSPPVSPDNDLVSAASSILEKEPYDTRILLTGAIPKIIAHYGSIGIAENIVNNLRRLGIQSLAVTDHDLHLSEYIFDTHHLEISDRALLFRDVHNELLEESKAEISLIIEGTVKVTLKRKGNQQQLKLNLAGTLLTGGIPVWRKVNTEFTGESSSFDHFVRLYKQDPGSHIVEMSQKTMNYSFLGNQLDASSANNFNTLVSKLKQLCPMAVFDNRLLKYSNAVKYSGKAIEDINVNCNLIYFFQRLKNHLTS